MTIWLALLTFAGYAMCYVLGRQHGSTKKEPAQYRRIKKWL